MKKTKYYILIFLFFIYLLFLTGCSNEETNQDIKKKVSQELEYLDSQIVSIVNNLNNISMQNYEISSEEVALGEESSNGNSNSQSQSNASEGEQKKSSSQNQSEEDGKKSNITTTQMEANTVLDSDENNIDWKSIKTQIETINEAWTVVVLDLSNLNIDNNDILNFSATLDDCIISIKDENKVNSLTNIAKLYSYIPIFEKDISSENSTQNIKQVKSHIINAYAVVEQGDWVTVENNIVQAEKTYKNITTDIEYMKDKEYKVNKTYVLIKELQNSLEYKDRKLFYVKYKNLMESVNTL
jgi:hypothetical protein